MNVTRFNQLFNPISDQYLLCTYSLIYKPAKYHSDSDSFARYHNTYSLVFGIDAHCTWYDVKMKIGAFV